MYISPLRSPHVVLLQPEALITIKRCLISKHMGKIQALQLLPHLRNRLLVIPTRGGVFIARVLPSVLSIHRQQHQKNVEKDYIRVFYQEKSCLSACLSIYHPIQPFIRPPIHPSDLLTHHIMGQFSLLQPITLWSFSGNCLVLLQ